MLPVRRVTALPAGAVAMVLLAGAVASAQPVMPRDAPVFRKGIFEVTPLVFATGGYATNIHEETPPIPSPEFVGFGQVQTQVKGNQFILTTVTAGERAVFTAASEENANHWMQRVVIEGQQRIRPVMNVRYRDTFARPTGYEIGKRSRHKSLQGTLGFDWKTGARTSLSGDGSASATRYDADAEYQGSILQETLNNKMYSGRLTFHYRVSPIVSFGSMVMVTKTNYVNNPSRNTDGYDVFGSVALSRPQRLNGVMQIGYSKFTPKDARPYSGLAGEGAIVYTPASGWFMSGQYLRDTNTSYTSTLSYYVLSTIGGMVGRRLGAGFEWRAVGGYQWLDYRAAGTAAGLNRVDKRYDYGGTLSRRVGHWASIGGTVTYFRKSGEIGYSGLRSNVFLIYGGGLFERLDMPSPGTL